MDAAVPDARSARMTTQLLDSLPILVVFAAFAVFTMVCYEGGFRLGRWWQDREPGEQEGPTGMLVGSILALQAFLLAVTIGMASDRFDARRGIVLAEANSIGTTYLRAGYLPDPASTQIRELLREYVPIRIVPTEVKPVDLAADIQRSQQILDELWAISEDVARTTDKGDLVSLYLDSLNETINLNETRITAGLYTRVPETVVLLLVGGSALGLGMVGYSAGLTKRRGLLNALVLVLALGAVIMVVVDLDRPRDGFIQVSQQPLLDLQRQIGPPAP